MKKVLIGILMLVLLPVLVSAKDYYVDKDSIGGTCNDNNQGTLEEPWCTIRKASSELRAGDTVYIRASIYTTADNGCVLHIKYSGTSGSRITWKNYNDEEVILRGQAYGIKFNGQDYVTVDGLTIDNVNIAASSMAIGADFWSAEHCILQNCNIRHMSPTVGSSGGRAVHFHSSSHYNQLLNSTVEYAGRTEAQGDDIGECVWIDGTHNLVQGCTIRFGGHNTVLIGGNYNILRDNTLDNTGWGRVMQTVTADESYRHLVADNIIRNASDYAGWGAPNCGMQFQASNTIFRRNRVYNSIGDGSRFSAGGATEVDNNRLYHNVFYNSGTDHDANYGYALQLISSTEGNLQGTDIRNNIFYNNYKDGISYGNSYASADDQTVINNSWNATDPKFTDPENGDFTLQSSSPCIDAGAWLAVTRSAGSGTSIPVNDASFFIDGWNIIDGDLIQLQGQSVTARITNVNYDTNTITVNGSLTWTNGQGVSLSYSGSAPDIGAYEFYSGSPPTEPVPGDLNNDGEVDIADLIIVAKNFGLTSGYDSAADTDSNNVIDIFDVVFVASRFT